MKLRALSAALLCLAALNCTPEPVAEPEPEPEEPEVPVDPDPIPEVHVDPVSIPLVEKGKVNLNYSYDESAGTWTLVSTGSDPYIFSAALESPLAPEHRVLSFDYQCSAGIDDLQVFYGKAISEARSRHFGAIPATIGTAWKTYSCSIASDRITHNWGNAGDNLRLDFGNKNGVKIVLKNIQLREMTADELKAYESELNKAKGKSAEAEKIAAYLSKSYSCRITDVSISVNDVTVKGTTDGSGSYYIADIAPWETPSLMNSFPNKVAVNGPSFNVTMSRRVSRDGLSEYDRVLSRFAVVKVDGTAQTLCSHARYPDAIYSKNPPAAVRPASKKGLGGFVYNENISDLNDLGITSVTVNILLNSVVNTVRSGNYKIEHKFGGVTYYMDSGYMGQLDRIMSECAKRNIVVSAILLNRQSDTNSKATALLKHPECDGGNYSMPNLTSAEAVNVYAAALDYLASRYSTSSPGRIHHWILHNEVDFQKEWTNMGDQPQARYMDSYVRSMRMCHNIAHKYDPNATVMISLTHCWAKAEGQYAPKSMLESLCRYSETEGDFLWGVAYHPYPQNLAKPEFWKDDSSATYSLNTPFCTFKNLEVVSAWMMDKAHFYKGTSKRLLFLSENGTNSPSYSESDLALQAAGAAWAWKKAAALEGIDGIQWHNWRDNRGEGGLRIGLRRFPDDSEAPNGKKPSWYVWQAAGTSSESSVLDQYLTTIGVASWNDIFQPLQ